MPSPFDTQILRFDDDLQVEARTVLSQAAEPQNAFEVAVLLETLGHTDATSRARGYDDLFDLARHLYSSLAHLGVVYPPRPQEFDPRIRDSGPSFVESVTLFVGQSLPWMTALFILVTVGTGFWSSTLLSGDQAAAMTLALAAGLGSSALFTFPFARRATFYRLQGNLKLISWTARWMLGTGAATCVAIMAIGYLVLERGLAALTPGDTKMFFAMGSAIALLQLAFAPLYTLRAFGWLAASTALGVAVLAVGLVQVDHGIFTNPSEVVTVQIAAIGVMVGTATIGSWWLLRTGGPPVTPPQKWATTRSVAPYSLYGTSFYLLVLAGGLTAGGAWHGSLGYARDYNVVTGAALIVLIPLFGYTTLAGERLPKVISAVVNSVSVDDRASAIAQVRSRFHRDLLTLLATGLVCGAGVELAAAIISPDLGVASRVWRNPALFTGALLAYVALAIGVLSSQMLFSLSRPLVPALGAATAFLVSAGVAGSMSLAFSNTTAAVWGLLAGTSVFATLAVRASNRAFSHFDGVYYASL